ncbi:helix-turn-helix domain-containing protein [Brevibacterium paucivorans]
MRLGRKKAPVQEHTTVEQIYFSISECARRLGVSQQSVRRFIDSGTLPAYRAPGTRVIRVHKDDLDSFFEPENPAVVEARKRVEA